MDRVAKVIAGRIASVALTLLAISLAVFVGTNLLPGDVAETLLGQASTPEAAAALRAALHADRARAAALPALAGGLLTGDPGLLAGQPPAGRRHDRRRACRNSLLLAALTAAVAVPVALPLGIAAAVWRGSVFDRAGRARLDRRHLRAGLPGRHRRGDPVRGRAAVVPRPVHRPRRPRSAALLQSFTLPVLTLCLGVMRR